MCEHYDAVEERYATACHTDHRSEQDKYDPWEEPYWKHEEENKQVFVLRMLTVNRTEKIQPLMRSTSLFVHYIILSGCHQLSYN